MCCDSWARNDGKLRETSCGAKEVRSPCVWRGGARHGSRVTGDLYPPGHHCLLPSFLLSSLYTPAPHPEAGAPLRGPVGGTTWRGEATGVFGGPQHSEAQWEPREVRTSQRGAALAAVGGGGRWVQASAASSFCSLPSLLLGPRPDSPRQGRGCGGWSGQG